MSQLTTNTASLQAILDAVNALPEAGGGEPTLQEKSVTPSTSAQTVTPDSGYDGLSKVTVNAMTTVTQATPSITVSTSGKITAAATQTAGYVAAGTKSATKQLTTQAAQTITPGTTNKTISSGRYLTGTQTIKGDTNLVAGNIKSGVSIFGVAGSYEGSGGSVETCTVSIGVYMFDKVIYTSDSGLVEDNNVMVASGKELQVQKNTILYAWCEERQDAFVVTGDGYLINSHVGSADNFYVFSITGDCTIDVEDEVVEPWW